MSKKVLIRKNAGAGVQGFYDISGQRPSFGQLANRTFRDPTASSWQKINAGLGMLGKVGAAGVTGMQTAHGLQGGNMGAALQVPQAYMALDPTAGQANAVTPHEQQMEMQRKNAEEQRKNQLAAMNTLGISAVDMYQRGARGQPAQAPYDWGNQAPQPQPAETQPAQAQPAQPAEQVAVPRPSVFSSAPPSPHPAGNRPPGMPQPAQAGVVNVGGGTLNPNMVAPIQSPAAPTGVPTSAPVGSEVQPAAQPAMNPQQVAQVIPPAAPGMFPQPPAAPAPAPVAPAPAPVPAPAPPAPAPAPVAVEKPVKNNWAEEESWVDEEPTFNDNRRADNTGKTAVLRPIRRGMGESNYSDDWDLTPEEIQRQKEFDARQQEARYQPRELTPSPGARHASTHAGNFIRTTPTVPMGQEPPVAVKTPVNTGGMGSNPIEDAKIPSLKDNPLFTGSGKDFGVPKGSNQERLQREESDKAFEDAYGNQEAEEWKKKYTPHPFDRMQRPFWDSVSDGVFTNSFTQMIFNEFGDMLRKADPHVAGLLAMRIYMDKFMR